MGVSFSLVQVVRLSFSRIYDILDREKLVTFATEIPSDVGIVEIKEIIVIVSTNFWMCEMQNCL